MMTKTLILGAFLHTLTVLTYGQKPSISIDDLGKWPKLSNEMITADGKYVGYRTRSATERSFTMKSTDGDWEVTIPNPTRLSLTSDSKYLIYLTALDTLGILQLGETKTEYVPNVKTFAIPDNDYTGWIAWQEKDKANTLKVRNLNTRKEIVTPNTILFLFGNYSSDMLVITMAGDTARCSIKFLNLLDNHFTNIWEGKTATNLCFDKNDHQVAFLAQRDALTEPFEIWTYRKGQTSAKKAADEHTSGFYSALKLGKQSRLRFSDDGSILFFGASMQKDTVIRQPRIWSYSDTLLQSEIAEDSRYEHSRTFLHALILHENRVTRIEFPQDMKVHFSPSGDADTLLVTTKSNRLTETNPSLIVNPSLFLVSTRTGERKALIHAKNITWYNATSFSQTGKYVLWYDCDQNAYMCYDRESNSVKNISKNIPAPLYDTEDDRAVVSRFPFLNSPATWTENDSSVLIYDKYDIWEVDPTSKKQARNITNGYGRSTHRNFRLLQFSNSSEQGAALKKGDTLILISFNTATKENGFYSIVYGVSRYPKKLTEGPCLYYLPQISTFSSLAFPFIPLKANNGKEFLVKRGKANEFPNLYLTKDFQHFDQLTRFAPEHRFNWLTDTLVHWTMLDGRTGTGVLYKPQDFDPNKKYPVIILYYERLSDGLHHYINAELSSDLINIPFYVSNHYLVLEADIYYKIGATKKSVANSVISAAKFLAKYPWVDKGKIAIQGHSFGGYETNLLVTSTNLFAVAAEVAGVCDLPSFYGSVRPSSGRSNQFFIEYDQNRIGSSIWQNRLAYIENSPLFFANKVTTPLLIVHNSNDGNVPWSEGLQWFLSLRRLNKRVWMLNYENEDHSIEEPADQVDYTLRLKQFFDYFLQSGAKPAWLQDRQLIGPR